MLRRWTTWLANRDAADVAGVGGAIGGTSGALLGWLTTTSGQSSSAATLAGVGAAVGGGLCLIAWTLTRIQRREPSSGRVQDRGEARLRQFRTDARADVRRQWRALLDGRDRLNAGFVAYPRIAPPHSFKGSLRQRSDLAAAVRSAAAPGGGPRLLLVAPPGFGKTVALLAIAQQVDDACECQFGVPVILNLGSWAHDDRDLGVWMVSKLTAATGLLPGADHEVKRWVEEGRIAPLLDGLDEIIDEERRRTCVSAINRFIDRMPDRTALVVASRPDEYIEITALGADRLAVNLGLELVELSSSQVDTRLRQVDADSASGLAALVAATPDHPVANLLRVPLWLWIAGTDGSDDPARLMSVEDQAEAEEILTKGYLGRITEDLGRATRVDQPTSRRFLATIAGFLAHPESPDSTTFRLEDLTPELPIGAHSRLTNLVNGVAHGLLTGLLIALFLGPAIGAVFGTLDGLVSMARVDRRHLRSLANGEPARARLQLPGPATLLTVLIEVASFGLRPRRVVRSLRKKAVFWAPIGVLGGLALTPLQGLGEGLVLGATAILIGVLWTGAANVGQVVVLREVMVRRPMPGDAIDEGRVASIQSVTLTVLTFGVLGGVVVGLLGALRGEPVMGASFGLVAGLAFGLDRGMDSGGWYLLMQRRLRRRATRDGLLPHNLVAFLEATADVGILRVAGGGVQFRHRVLAERLAVEAPTPGLAELRSQVGTDPTIEDAIERSTLAIEFDPDIAWYYGRRAWAYEEAGHHEQALTDLTRAIEIEADEPDWWEERGLLQGRVGDHDAAIQDLTRAIELKPSERLYIERALLRYSQGYDADAAADLNKALETSPDDTMTRVLLAVVYAVMDERVKFEESLDALNDNSFVAALHAGLVAYWLHLHARHEAATAASHKALEMDARNEWDLLGLALAHAVLGSTERAENQLSEALAGDAPIGRLLNSPLFETLNDLVNR